MKKNSGAALTSVVVVFLIVIMIGAPLLGMVVYNYRFREYDSGIKEAEYKNEVIMDRISTIIKNEVIAAISAAKEDSTADIANITDTLVNSYNSVYDEAVDEVGEFDKESGKLLNEDDVKGEIKNKFGNIVGSYDGVDTDSIVEILALDSAKDISNAQINDENLQIVCNSIFQRKYQNILIANLFEAIYNDDEYDDLASNRSYGKNEQLAKDDETGKTKESSLKIDSKYERSGKEYKYTYIKGNNSENIGQPIFGEDNKIEVGIESKYKLNKTVPLTTLSATYVIDTPDFNMISSIEQQTIALSNPTLEYSLIVGETLEVNGDLQVDGNVLARANGVIKNEEESREVGIKINDNSSLSEKVGGIVSNGRIATSGDIVMKPGSSLITGNNPIYYRNLYLGEPEKAAQSGEEVNVTFNGDVLAKDDLEINLNSKVTVTQAQDKNYFGYNDENDEGPDSSSAIVVNSDPSYVGNVELSLGNLYLAGRAFIDGVESISRFDNLGNNMIYKTGESISVKGNYVAYQTPLVNAGDYDISKVKFSPYFMTGTKSGIENETHLTVNLADNFINGSLSYENFDSQHKWKYFKKYVELGNAIFKPDIEIKNVKYVEGVAINNGSIVTRDDLSDLLSEQATMIGKGSRFDEFTKYFGYYPDDETKRKSTIESWINFADTDKVVQDGNFFVYVSGKGQLPTTKTLAWGTSDTGADINILVPNKYGVNGIIIHKGDLRITNRCDSDIPFNGIIIVTGNLIIDGDITLLSDREYMAKIIMENYLGENYTYSASGSSSELEEGDLLNTFVYDGSGTTYVAINVSARSNVIEDINTLIGIKDWKKQSYGRL